MAKDDVSKTDPNGHNSGLKGGITTLAGAAKDAVRVGDAIAIEPGSDVIAGLVNGGISIVEGAAKGGVELAQGNVKGAVTHTVGGVAEGITTGVIDGVPYVGEVLSGGTLLASGQSAGGYFGKEARDLAEGAMGGIKDEGAVEPASKVSPSSQDRNPNTKGTPTLAV